MEFGDDVELESISDDIHIIRCGTVPPGLSKKVEAAFKFCDKLKHAENILFHVIHGGPMATTNIALSGSGNFGKKNSEVEELEKKIGGDFFIVPYSSPRHNGIKNCGIATIVEDISLDNSLEKVNIFYALVRKVANEGRASLDFLTCLGLDISRSEIGILRKPNFQSFLKKSKEMGFSNLNLLECLFLYHTSKIFPDLDNVLAMFCDINFDLVGFKKELGNADNSYKNPCSNCEQMLIDFLENGENGLKKYDKNPNDIRKNGKSKSVPDSAFQFLKKTKERYNNILEEIYEDEEEREEFCMEVKTLFSFLWDKVCKSNLSKSAFGLGHCSEDNIFDYFVNNPSVLTKPGKHYIFSIDPKRSKRNFRDMCFYCRFMFPKKMKALLHRFFGFATEVETVNLLLAAFDVKREIPKFDSLLLLLTFHGYKKAFKVVVKMMGEKQLSVKNKADELCLLHSAVNLNNEELVGELVDKIGVDVYKIHIESGCTPLHIAALQKNTSIFLKLLDKGKNALTIGNTFGYTPLHYVVYSSGLDAVKAAFAVAKEMGYDVNVKKTETDETPLHLACSNGNIDIIDHLVGKKVGANWNAMDSKGRTPFSYAVIERSVPHVVTHIMGNHLSKLNIKANFGVKEGLYEDSPAKGECDYELDDGGPEGRSILHSAALFGYYQVFDSLQKLSDKDVVKKSIIHKDKQNHTVLHWAVKSFNSQRVKEKETENKVLKSVLNWLGVEDQEYVRTTIIDAETKKGTGVLHFAAQGCAKGTVEHLVSAGADVNLMNKDGTPLRAACFYDNAIAVKELLAAGAKVNFEKEGYSKIPLHVAAEKSSVEIIKMLLHFGADVNLQSIELETPLHIAVEFRRTEVIKELLKVEGIKVNLMNGCGATPLHLALYRKYDDIVELLAKDERVDCFLEDRLNGRRPIEFSWNFKILKILFKKEYEKTFPGITCDRMCNILTNCIPLINKSS